MRLLFLSIYVAMKFLKKLILKKFKEAKQKVLSFKLPELDLDKLQFNTKLTTVVAACVMFCLFANSSAGFNSKAVFAVDSPESETETINLWWKADIASYDNLSLVDYAQAPEVKSSSKNEDKPHEYFPSSTTTAVTTAVTTAPVTTTEPAVTSVLEVEPPPEIEVPVAPEKEIITPVSGSFTFVTYGWGHGVGLSQNGANFYAKYGGYNYRQILEHYYPGVTIAQSGLTNEWFTIDGMTVPAIDAVAGVVANEMSSSFDSEALKAQIVAVYTIFKYNNGDANGLHMKAVPDKIYNLVREVMGEACYFGGGYAMTVFSASCGGASANCCDVFVADLPYLRSVPSEYDATYDPHYGTVKEISAERVRELVEPYFEITLSDDPYNWFTIESIGDGGYVTRLNLDGQMTIKATSLRACLSLKSTNFEIIF
jgi:peptidoglycan hydrolase-like amidase